MRALLCLALVPAALATAAFASGPISRGDAMDLKRDIAGEYRLENGRDVRLALVEDRLYLDLNRHYRREVEPIAENVLASRDGSLTVQYLPDGPSDRIVIRHPELPANARLGEHSWRGR
ncbi:hypothetical protein [Massilia sp. GCM10023247]|uniref:hypothetical protein n=1 Tax=Massilia sp. GCM10023247 TaxID=3252643 RepID=UPI003609A1AB